jgi:hypothetical protein
VPADPPAGPTDRDPENPPDRPVPPGLSAPAAGAEPGGARSPAAPGGAEVRARPVRLRRLSAAVAAALVLVSAVVALLSGRSSNGTPFGLPDRIALFCLGLLLAAGVLLLGRPAVVADARGLRVRNLGGERQVPWALVRGISVRGRAPWASLELIDDETMPLLAVQVLDGAQAVHTVRALRALLARSAGPDAAE